MKEFDYTLDYDNINFRENPELYRIGRGEQGVLLVEPYKSEICQHWRFRTPEIAKISSDRITTMFHDYVVRGDFVGADMARKFLMIGWTSARRYANHRSGKKYDENGRSKLLLTEYQWYLISQLFDYIPHHRTQTSNEWMMDELDKFIEEVNERWESA